ncbi:MAG: hypothetical protein VX112_05410 [Pseudomonadota bacterium]|nr:hypothetical protein [Pseudomonadota bacterium]
MTEKIQKLQNLHETPQGLGTIDPTKKHAELSLLRLRVFEGITKCPFETSIKTQNFKNQAENIDSHPRPLQDNKLRYYYHYLWSISDLVIKSKKLQEKQTSYTSQNYFSEYEKDLESLVDYAYEISLPLIELQELVIKKQLKSNDEYKQIQPFLTLLEKQGFTSYILKKSNDSSRKINLWRLNKRTRIIKNHYDRLVQGYQNALKVEEKHEEKLKEQHKLEIISQENIAEMQNYYGITDTTKNENESSDYGTTDSEATDSTGSVELDHIDEMKDFYGEELGIDLKEDLHKDDPNITDSNDNIDAREIELLYDKILMTDEYIDKRFAFNIPSEMMVFLKSLTNYNDTKTYPKETYSFTNNHTTTLSLTTIGERDDPAIEIKICEPEKYLANIFRTFCNYFLKNKIKPDLAYEKLSIISTIDKEKNERIFRWEKECYTPSSGILYRIDAKKEIIQCGQTHEKIENIIEESIDNTIYEDSKSNPYSRLYNYLHSYDHPTIKKLLDLCFYEKGMFSHRIKDWNSIELLLTNTDTLKSLNNDKDVFIFLMKDIVKRYPKHIEELKKILIKKSEDTNNIHIKDYLVSKQFENFEAQHLNKTLFKTMFSKNPTSIGVKKSTSSLNHALRQASSLLTGKKDRTNPK